MMSTEQTSETNKLLGLYDDEMPIVEASPRANVRRSGGGQCASSAQDYRQSEMYGSEIEHDILGHEDAFFGAKLPNLVIHRELPVHRLICYLKAQGLSNREISSRVSKSESWISQVIRQPWAQERIVAEIREAGRDSLQGILASQAEDSVWTLVEIRDDVKAKNADRAQCANSLLDRLLGRPNQPITHSGKVDPTTLSDEELVKLCTKDGQTSGNI